MRLSSNIFHILCLVFRIIQCELQYEAGKHERIVFYTNPTKDFKTDTPKTHNGLIYYAGESLEFQKVIHVYNGTSGDFLETVDVSNLISTTANSNLKTNSKIEDYVILYYRRIQSRPELIIAYDYLRKEVAWKYEQPNAAVFEPSPVFENGFIYFLQAFAGVYEFMAMNATSGKVMWKLTNMQEKPFCSYTYGTEVCMSIPLKDMSGNDVDVTGDWGHFKQPSYQNGTIFVNLESTVLAMDATGGVPVYWSTDMYNDYNVQRYSPQVFDDIVYTIALKQYACNKTFNDWPYWTCSEPPYDFFALSAQTGDILWQRTFAEEIFPDYFWFHWYEIGQHIAFLPEKNYLHISVKYYMHKPDPYFQLNTVDAKTGEDVWNIELTTDPDQSYRSLWDAYQNSLLFINSNENTPVSSTPTPSATLASTPDNNENTPVSSTPTPSLTPTPTPRGSPSFSSTTPTPTPRDTPSFTSHTPTPTPSGTPSFSTPTPTPTPIPSPTPTLYHVDTSTGLVRAIDALIGEQIWQEPTNLRYSHGTITGTSLYLSQQHISESVISSKDNYILGITLAENVGNCSWCNDAQLFNLSGIILENRVCVEHNHTHGHTNGTHSVHPAKKNQLLGDFLGVLISITVSVLL